MYTTRASVMFLLSLMFAAIFAAGCRGTSKATERNEVEELTDSPNAHDARLDSLDPQFRVDRRGDGNFYLGMVAGAAGTSDSPKMVAIRSITAVTFRVFTADNRLLHTGRTEEINSSGVTNVEEGASLTSSAGVVWSPATAPGAGTYAEMTVHSRTGRITRRATLVESSGGEQSRVEPILLTLDTRDMAGGVEFVLTVERRGPGPQGEVVPTAEKYRIEIQSAVGETIWSSSARKIFKKVSGPVEPVNVGGRVEYRAHFNGTSDLTRSRLQPGGYRIIAIIPARPKPYILREEFTWSGN